MWSQSAAQRAIVVAGCFAMAYTQLTLSPASIEFARALGGDGLHIGILGALPTGMLFMQFLAAVVANHLHYRRRLWFSVSLVQRLLFLPIALGPMLFPEWSDNAWIWALIAVTALNHGMLHFSTPLWLSWMGDYLPHIGLNRFWGVRHLWMQWSAALSLCVGAVYLLRSGTDIRQAFSVLLVTGAVFGVADLLLFLKVDEPPVKPAPELKLRTVLSAPFRNPDFRSFISFTCFWHFAAMLGAPFISLYLLAYVGMDLFHVLMLWACSWVGGAVFSNRLGILAEEHGHRPLLILCTAFKSTNMIALLLVPRDPELAFWILIPVFMVDAVLNAGIAIANNGFMIKNSPSENRTMFIAAGTAVAGMVGGITSISAGAILSRLDGWSVEIVSYSMNGFHLLFIVSLFFRLVAAVLARGIQEPHARGTIHVVTQLVGVTPIRVLRFPVGLYRSYRAGNGTPVPGPKPDRVEALQENRP